jgi:lipopolysaccharide export system permease protein
MFSLSALTSLLLINYIAKRFGELVGKGLPPGVIAEFFFLSVPFTVAMTLPMSVLVATLYAFSRLASENEIMALKANGVSMVRLLVPILLAASVLSVGMVAFNDGVLPQANHRLRTLQGDIARKKPTFALREQIINEVSARGYFLRTNHLDQYSGQMREVTIYDLTDPLRRRTIYADSGKMAFAPNGSDLLLTLRHGYMLEVPKTEPAQLQRLHFDSNFVRVTGVANQLDLTLEDSYKSDREMSICELQNEVARSEHELDQSLADLRAALAQATREALTGKPATRVPSVSATAMLVTGTPVPPSRRVTLGSVYCDAMQRVRRLRLLRFVMVPRAAAAEVHTASPFHAPQQQQRDTTRPRPDSARKADAAAVKAQRPDSGRVRGDTSRPRGDTAATRADTAATLAPVSAAPTTDSAAVPMPTAAAAAPPVAAPPTSSTPYLLATQIASARQNMMDMQRRMNQYAVELHKKIAISVACIVFVLVGAPIALRFPRGGVGLVVGVSLVVFGIYYVGLIAGEALADRDVLTPFWAMWSANIVLTAAGLVLLARMGRESATSRGGDLHEMIDIVRGFWHALWARGRDGVGAGAS